MRCTVLIRGFALARIAGAPCSPGRSTSPSACGACLLANPPPARTNQDTQSARLPAPISISPIGKGLGSSTPLAERRLRWKFRMRCLRVGEKIQRSAIGRAQVRDRMENYRARFSPAFGMEAEEYQRRSCLCPAGSGSGRRSINGLWDQPELAVEIIFQRRSEVGEAEGISTHHQLRRFDALAP